MNNEPEMNTTEELDMAPEAPKKGNGFLKSAFDFVEMFAISVVAVLFIFSLCLRLCRVDGNSMNKTLVDQEMLITTSLFYEPQQGDIIVFHLSNDYYKQPLVKRVIATEGQTVKINFISGEVTVDGKLLDERYIYVDGGIYRVKTDFDRYYMRPDDNGDLVFEAKVPEGKIFVMGDNRNHSTDSRSHLVGFVDKDCVLGKAILRLDPFTVFD